MIGFDVLPEYAQSNRELLGEGLVVQTEPSKDQGALTRPVLPALSLILLLNSYLGNSGNK